MLTQIQSSDIGLDVILDVDLASNSVGTSEIQDNAVVSSKLARNLVLGSNVSNTLSIKSTILSEIIGDNTLNLKRITNQTGNIINIIDENSNLFLVFDKDGKLGIKVNPIASLHIGSYGDILFDYGSNHDNYITFGSTGYTYFRTWNGTENSIKLRITNDGKIEWYDGSNLYDVNLYRNNVNVLKTDDSFVIGNNLYLASNNSIIYFGTDSDVNLYRFAENILKTDDDFIVNNSETSGKSASISIIAGNSGFSNLYFGDTDNATIGRIGINHTNNYMYFDVAGSTKLYLTNNGEIQLFYSGNPGVKIWLDGLNILSIGGNVVINDTIFSATGTIILGNAISNTTTIKGSLVLIDSDGTHTLKLGADVDLYRESANVLKIDDTLNVNGNLYSSGEVIVNPTGIIRLKNDNAAIYFGSTDDIILYRNGSDTLKTDDNLIVGLTLTVNGNSILGSGNTNTTTIRGLVTLQDSSVTYPLRFGSDVNLYRDIIDGVPGLSTGRMYLNSLYMGGIINADSGIATHGANIYLEEGAIYYGSSADVKLYRSAADTLKTDDNFEVQYDIIANGQIIAQNGLVVNDGNANIYGYSYFRKKNGVGEVDFVDLDLLFVGNNKIIWQNDTNLYRDSANTLKTDDNLIVGGNLNINGLISSADSSNLKRLNIRNTDELKVVPRTTPDNKVTVRPGTFVKSDGTGSVTFTGGDSPIFPPVTTNPRIDLLCIDDAGVLSRIAGTENSSPLPENYPTNKQVLAEITITETGTVVIDENDIKDVRMFLNLGGGGAGGTVGVLPRYAAFIATEGQTVFDLPFSYQQGDNSLQVFCDGILKRVNDDYVETSSTRVTFNTGRIAGEKVTFRVMVGTSTNRVETSFTNQTTVVVNHNLNAYPQVQVIDNNNAVIIPNSIVHNSTNQLTITFASPESGTVICITGSSGRSDVTIKVKAATGGLSTYDVIYKTTNSDEYGKADSNSESTMPACGIMLTNLAVGNTGDALIIGEVSNPSWNWTVGGKIYVSASGSLTQTPPSGSGKVVQIVGYAKNTTTVVFNFNNIYTVLA